MEEIIVNEVQIEEAIKVHKNVFEFSDDTIDHKAYFENRYKDSEKLIIVAYYRGKPIGYIVGYDRAKDGKRFYCWMAGVDNNYRRMGALKRLMDYQIDWAKKKGYSKIEIKTRNERREMLSFLVKNDFNFISVESRENALENRIDLEREI